MSRKKPKKVRDDPQDIDTIIHSFENYALGDIKDNANKPIACMILCMCFIDQLASFGYPILMDSNKRPEAFINDYMPDFKGLDLYDMFRHNLIHTYSSGDRFCITNEGYEEAPFTKINERTYINTHIFVAQLDSAFRDFVKQLRDDKSPAHQNAIENSKYHPVLVGKDS
jgi:hypothetical protein